MSWQYSAQNPYASIVWRLGSTLEPLLIKKAHKKYVNTLDIIEDNYLVSGGGEGFIKVWKIDSGLTMQGKMDAHLGGVKCLAVPSPRTLLSSGNCIIKVWDIESLSPVHKGYHEHNRPVRCLALRNPSTFLSGSEDASIKLWDVRSARSIATFSGHAGTVGCVDMWDEYSFLTGSED